MQLESVIKSLLKSGAHHARWYRDSKYVIRATRILYKGRPRSNKTEVVVTCGKPNHYERNFIKRHGVPKGIQLDRNKC